MWNPGSIGAWGEIFTSDSVTQEQLRLFESCITAGPRFVRAARGSKEYAHSILEAIRDDSQFSRIAHGVRKRRPFNDEATAALPQAMRPNVPLPDAADSGGEDTTDDGPLHVYTSEEEEEQEQQDIIREDDEGGSQETG